VPNSEGGYARSSGVRFREPFLAIFASFEQLDDVLDVRVYVRNPNNIAVTSSRETSGSKAPIVQGRQALRKKLVSATSVRVQAVYDFGSSDDADSAWCLR
jgi:hypothetical protein